MSPYTYYNTYIFFSIGVHFFEGFLCSILEPRDQINQAYNIPFDKIAKGHFINDDSSEISLQKILMKKYFRSKKEDSLTCDEEEA